MADPAVILWLNRVYLLVPVYVSRSVSPYFGVSIPAITEQDLFTKQKYDLRAMIFTYLVVMIVSDGITSTVTSRSMKKYTRTKKEIDATN